LTSIRQATPDDARAVAVVRAASWRATYPSVVEQRVLDELDVDASERWWRAAVTAEGVAVLLAERDRRVVGFVSAGPSENSPDVGQV